MEDKKKKTEAEIAHDGYCMNLAMTGLVSSINEIMQKHGAHFVPHFVSDHGYNDETASMQIILLQAQTLRRILASYVAVVIEDCEIPNAVALLKIEVDGIWCDAVKAVTEQTLSANPQSEKDSLT